MSSVKVSGQRSLVQRLKRISARMPGLLTEAQAGEFLAKRMLRRFDAQMAPDGSKWKPLDDVALARKKRRGYGDKPLLVNSGSLRDAIGVILGGREGLFAVNSGLGVRVGIREEEQAFYGRLHNYGFGVQTMRKFIGFNELDIGAVQSLLRRKAQQIIRG